MKLITPRSGENINNVRVNLHQIMGEKTHNGLIITGEILKHIFNLKASIKENFLARLSP